MKKIVFYLLDGTTTTIQEGLDELELIDSFDNFYDDLKILKINDYEYKLYGFRDEYQIFNIETKELYNDINQSGVFKVSMNLDEEEFQHIMKIIKRKENDNNN